MIAREWIRYGTVDPWTIRLWLDASYFVKEAEADDAAQAVTNLLRTVRYIEDAKAEILAEKAALTIGTGLNAVEVTYQMRDGALYYPDKT